MVLPKNQTILCFSKTSFHSKVLSNVDRNFKFNFLVNFNFVLSNLI